MKPPKQMTRRRGRKLGTRNPRRITHYFRVRGSFRRPIKSCPNTPSSPVYSSCGSNSATQNVAGASEIELAEQTNESNNASTIAAISASMSASESRSFWHSHRFLNFLLACMVFAFVVSWLFHFNVPSS